ncbi:MAG: hypothetical protein ACI8P3_001950, partial [Saprospiraceae bacterium]
MEYFTALYHVIVNSCSPKKKYLKALFCPIGTLSWIAPINKPELSTVRPVLMNRKILNIRTLLDL